MKNLKEAKIGETVRVVKIHGEGAIKRRIMDMGLTKGVEVYIRKGRPAGLIGQPHRGAAVIPLSLPPSPC